jgi:hypothetical protein
MRIARSTDAYASVLTLLFMCCHDRVQISHHPPVSAYQLQGPGWALSGWSQPAVVPVVKFYGIKTVAKGARHINFADGSTVEMSMPNFAIKGELGGMLMCM